MAKLAVTYLDSLANQTSAIQTINANLTNIATALENTISRDGTTPNTLTASLDANSKEVYNLGAPSNSSSAARLIDVQNGVTLTGYAIPALTGNSGKRLATDGTTIFWSAGGSGDVVAANNGSEFPNKTTFRTNIGLGSSATINTGTSGATIPLLNGNLTFSGVLSFTGDETHTGTTIFSGSTDVRLTKVGRTTIAADSVGYLGAPQNTQDSNYTLILEDAGKGISHTSASPHTWTVPPNSAVAFPIHTTIVMDNSGAGAVTIARGAGVTIRAAGSGTSADQSLAQFFVKTIYKVGTDTWVAL
jgi:hypothetical protein